MMIQKNNDDGNDINKNNHNDNPIIRRKTKSCNTRRMFRTVCPIAIFLILMILEDEMSETVQKVRGNNKFYVNAYSVITSSSRFPTWERRRPPPPPPNDGPSSFDAVANNNVVVVGKIIIDEYRSSPSSDGDEKSDTDGHFKRGGDDHETKKITIGGGGPQAAWGAAAALAVMDSMMEEGSSSSPPITGSERDGDERSGENSTSTESNDHRRPPVPPQQPVAFLGPVGNVNGLLPSIQEGLDEILGMAVRTIELVVEPSLQTPTIQLWHDEKQDIQWKPLNDSWGSKGADALWRDRPSAGDVLQLDCSLQPQEAAGEELEDRSDDGTDANDASGGDDQQLTNWRLPAATISNLHLILEMGSTAAGGGRDGRFLFDEQLMSRVSHLSIEPVAFPEEIGHRGCDGDGDGDDDDDRGEDDETADGALVLAIPRQDVASSEERLRPHLGNLSVIIPDSHLVDAWIESGFLQELVSQQTEVIGRFGPAGSRIYFNAPGKSSTSPPSSLVPAVGIEEEQEQQQRKRHQEETRSRDDELDCISVPVATLETSSGKPTNPTGAGNAYSAAFSTCRSVGWEPDEAACLATAIGATVCEHEHLPPWTWDVLDRIERGAREVYDAIGKDR